MRVRNPRPAWGLGNLTFGAKPSPEQISAFYEANKAYPSALMAFFNTNGVTLADFMAATTYPYEEVVGYLMWAGVSEGPNGFYWDSPGGKTYTVGGSGYVPPAPAPAPAPAPVPEPAPAPAVAAEQTTASGYPYSAVLSFFEANKSQPAKIVAWANQYGITIPDIVAASKVLNPPGYTMDEALQWLDWAGIEFVNGQFRMRQSAAPAPAPAPVYSSGGGGGGGGWGIPSTYGLTNSLTDGGIQFDENSFPDDNALTPWLIGGAVIGAAWFFLRSRRSQAPARRRSSKRSSSRKRAKRSAPRKRVASRKYIRKAR